MAVSDITAVSGSLADLVSVGFTIAENVKSQDGLKYNLHTFNIPPAAADKDPQGESASPTAAIADRNKTKAADSSQITATRAKVVRPAGKMKSLLVVRAKGIKAPLSQKIAAPGSEVKAGSGILHFGIALRSSSDDDAFENGQVVLMNAIGFDTGIGSQAEFEFSGQEWSDIGYLLAFTGHVNPLGSGFVRIAGGVLVTKRGIVTPQGSWNGLGKMGMAFGNDLKWQDGTGFEVDI